MNKAELRLAIMTNEQLNDVLKMSNKDFFLRYYKKVATKQMTHKQYEALMQYRTSNRVTQKKEEIPTVEWDKIFP